MNKKELVGAIVDKTGFTKKDSEALELLREKQESAEIQESQNSLITSDVIYIISGIFLLEIMIKYKL